MAVALDAPDGKRVLLVRHGHSTYNAWRERSLHTCMCLCATWEDHDAPLSDKGRRQVNQLRKKVCSQGLHREVQLVVTSPLTRAIDTARGAFWGVLPDGTADHPDASCSGRMPMVVLASIAERLDTACDIGRPASELGGLYQDVDFGLLQEHWWYGGEANWPAPGQPHEKEPWSACQRRITETIEWLQERPETCIAVVGHSAFFQAMTGSWAKMPNCGIVEIRVPPAARVELPAQRDRLAPSPETRESERPPPSSSPQQLAPSATPTVRIVTRTRLVCAPQPAPAPVAVMRPPYKYVRVAASSN